MATEAKNPNSTREKLKIFVAGLFGAALFGLFTAILAMNVLTFFVEQSNVNLLEREGKIAPAQVVKAEVTGGRNPRYYVEYQFSAPDPSQANQPEKFYNRREVAWSLFLSVRDYGKKEFEILYLPQSPRLSKIKEGEERRNLDVLMLVFLPVCALVAVVSVYNALTAFRDK
jgi:Protein of unknown function (DUF3592)